MGILGMAASGIPLPWKILIATAIITSALGGTYYYAYNRAETITTDKYELKIAKYANEQKDLKQQLTDERALVRENVVIRYLYKVQEVEKLKIVYRDISNHDVPSQYALSTGWIYLHDQAALGLPPDETLSKDSTPSTIMDNQALAIVAENYGTCHEKDAQINALRDYVHAMQDWAAKVKSAVDKANKSVLPK